MSIGRYERLHTRPASAGRPWRAWIALVLAVVMVLMPVAHAIAAISAGEAVTGSLGGAEHRHHESDHGHSHDDDDEPSTARMHWLAGHWHGHDHGGVDHAHEAASALATTEFRSTAMIYRMEWRTPRDLRAAFDLGAGLERPPRRA